MRANSSTPDLLRYESITPQLKLRRSAEDVAVTSTQPGKMMRPSLMSRLPTIASAGGSGGVSSLTGFFESFRGAKFEAAKQLSSGSTSTRSLLPSLNWDEKWVGYGAKDSVYDPNTEKMIDSLHSALAADSERDLSPRYNTMVLHLLEAFRKMEVEAGRSLEIIHEQKTELTTITLELADAKVLWDREKERYLGEIRRLEQDIAQGMCQSNPFSTSKRETILEQEIKALDHHDSGNCSMESSSPKRISRLNGNSGKLE
jgi:hypothetical protein